MAPTSQLVVTMERFTFTMKSISSGTLTKGSTQDPSHRLIGLPIIDMPFQNVPILSIIASISSLKRMLAKIMPGLRKKIGLPLPKRALGPVRVFVSRGLKRFKIQGFC